MSQNNRTKNSKSLKIRLERKKFNKLFQRHLKFEEYILLFYIISQKIKKFLNEEKIFNNLLYI